MTNYVCYHHDRDNYILPSPHLNVEITKDQRKAINPTTGNIQIGAVIGQIFGDKAKTEYCKASDRFYDWQCQQLRVDFERAITVGKHYNVQQPGCLTK